MLNGLSCLDAMVSLSWEFLYPDATQIRSRIKALEWLNEKLTRAIRQRPPETAEIEAVIHCISEARALDNHLAEKWQDGRPMFGELTALLEKYTSVASNGHHRLSAPRASQIIESPVPHDTLN